MSGTIKGELAPGSPPRYEFRAIVSIPIDLFQKRIQLWLDGPSTSQTGHIQRAFVSDGEVHRLVADWKLRGAPDYEPDIVTGGTDEPFLNLESNGATEQDDALYDEAVSFVLESRRASISSVQRKLRIGYNRAARLVEAMEDAGLVSAMNSNGSREVLVPHRD